MEKKTGVVKEEKPNLIKQFGLIEAAQKILGGKGERTYTESEIKKLVDALERLEKWESDVWELDVAIPKDLFDIIQDCIKALNQFKQ